MKENDINRRRMIKIGSITALSTLVSPALVTAKTSISSSETHNYKIANPDDVCFMNAVEIAALLRTKKISAREVMQAGTIRTSVYCKWVMLLSKQLILTVSDQRS